MKSAVFISLGWMAITSGVVLAERPAATPIVGLPEPSRKPAAALVFDPLITQMQPRLELSREGRAMSAYLGYEQATTTFSYTRYDDRVRFEQGSGSFERRATGERIGIIVR